MYVKLANTVNKKCSKKLRNIYLVATCAHLLIGH